MPKAPAAFVKQVSLLVSKFDADRTHYQSKEYLEAQLRVDFVTPLFEALGWDVNNRGGLNHRDRECLVEKGKTEGRPDYNFRISGETKFFAESKSPSEPINNPRHIVQAKAYAWNSKDVFFIVLTNFAEFRLYDASIQPDERNPDEGLLFSLRYDQYVANSAQLWDLSKERTVDGSLDALLPRDRRTQRLRVPVDKRFLEDITEWRGELARNIFHSNPGITAQQLNEVVQRLLDRIIFIRIAEDRHIVEKRLLADVVDEWKARGGKLHIYRWLNDLFHRINEDFNGEIFKPHLSEKLNVDSEALVRVIERLYPPKSVYRFDVIGVELLGSIYERYLGKTIRTTAKQVRIEDKPEVRKAGGVYYTPKHIVDYIVRHTMGDLVRGKTPKQLEKLRIVDPACGSGSFLIGAFQYLVDYHLRFLGASPPNAQKESLFPDVVAEENGGHRLSVVLKTRILKNNIYGIDKDPQAVEITMMSLYLKALEGEKSILPPKQSVLPEMKQNILCGNTLVEPDIGGQGELFGAPAQVEAVDDLRPFDWNAEQSGFGTIMKSGGFDAVIGNPPYIFITGVEQGLRDYYASKYKTWSYRYDVYGLFIEKALTLLKKSRPLGFIIPHTLLNNDSFANLRRLLLDKACLDEIVDIGPGVFEGVGNETMILLLTKGRAPSAHNLRYIKTTAGTFFQMAKGASVRQKQFDAPPKYPFVVITDKTEKGLIEKLAGTKTKFGDFFHINQGLRTGDNDTYLSDKKKTKKHKPALGGKDVGRYWHTSAEFVLYDPTLLDAPRDENNFTSAEKIIVQEIRNIALMRRIVASYDNTQMYCLQSTNTMNWRSPDNKEFAMRFALGVLNSELLNW